MTTEENILTSSRNESPNGESRKVLPEGIRRLAARESEHGLPNTFNALRHDPELCRRGVDEYPTTRIDPPRLYDCTKLFVDGVTILLRRPDLANR